MSSRNLWDYNRSSWKTPSRGVVAGGCLLILLIMILSMVIGTAIVLAAWSYVIAPVFHLGPIDWGQAFLIYLLIWLIRSSVVHVSRSS